MSARDIIAMALCGFDTQDESTGHPMNLIGLTIEKAKHEASELVTSLDGHDDALTAGSLEGRLDALLDFMELYMDVSWKERREPKERAAADVREELQAQAKNDVQCCLADDEWKAPYDPTEWFNSWLDGECECALGPFTKEQAFKVYEAAFADALAEADAKTNGAERRPPNDDDDMGAVFARDDGADDAEGSAES